MKVTAVILTKNEESNIKRCLDSLAWVDEVVVVDDFSSDSTTKIAKNYGAKIYERELSENFANSRNFGISKSSNDWILFVDADEIISSDLAMGIKTIKPSGKTAYLVKRNDHLWGRELRHGDVKNVWITRLVKKNTGMWERRVHEVWISNSSSKMDKLAGEIKHFPHSNVGEFVESVRKYALLHAKVLHKQGVKSSIWQVILYPVGKFMYNYFIKLGFLDGTVGFVHAMMMSFHSFIARSMLLMTQNEAS